MLSSYIIKNGEWKKISLAGQNGKAWLKDSIDGTAKIVIAHTDTVQTGGAPVGDNIPLAAALDLDINIGYTLSESGDPVKSDVLSADNGNDVFYATLRDIGDDAIIITDFV